MKKKQQQHLQKDLKNINTALNTFLKQCFTLELDSLQQYLHSVKDLLIELTTKQMAPIVTNVFSKFSNILQPFTSYSYDLSLDSLKQEVSLLRERSVKLEKKLRRVNETLEEYRVKGNRMGDFISMLRVNNVPVDELYRRGVMQAKVQAQQPQPPLPRMVPQLQREQWMSMLNQNQDSTLLSQYISTKSKR